MGSCSLGRGFTVIGARISSMKEGERKRAKGRVRGREADQEERRGNGREGTRTKRRVSEKRGRIKGPLGPQSQVRQNDRRNMTRQTNKLHEQKSI